MPTNPSPKRTAAGKPAAVRLAPTLGAVTTGNFFPEREVLVGKRRIKSWKPA